MTAKLTISREQVKLPEPTLLDEILLSHRRLRHVHRRITHGEAVVPGVGAETVPHVLMALGGEPAQVVGAQRVHQEAAVPVATEVVVVGELGDTPLLSHALVQSLQAPQ